MPIVVKLERYGVLLKRYGGLCTRGSRQFQTWSCAMQSGTGLSGGKTSSSSAPLLLSPAESTRILRANESTIDIESKSAIKYYDINYLGANNPPEDRQTQAKFLHSDVYLFGVFDGHGGWLKEILYIINRLNLY